MGLGWLSKLGLLEPSAAEVDKALLA